MLDSPLHQMIVYLAAMILVVPLFKRLGLGAVLGYLVAGLLLGESGFGLLSHTGRDASHLAEFGVIMMLLLIGLELNPRLLWQMRGQVLGLGSLQVLVSAAAVAAIAWAAAWPWQTAVAAGLILSLSSTAIVLKTLEERGLAKSTSGEAAFAVLLFQDIAVIPMLALLPILASSLRQGGANLTETQGHSWAQAGVTLAVITGLVVAGRYLVRPGFRLLARANLREVFTAAALLLVVGTTALMQKVGLSPAMGAFLAGVVLADSEFRHQLEADLEPFKGLLLGLFFISVGADIDLGWALGRPREVLTCVAALILTKGLVVMGLGRLFGLPFSDALLLGVSLAQGGEFCFVLLGHALDSQLLGADAMRLLTASVALSMALAPLLILATVRWLLPRLQGEGTKVAGGEAPVPVAGSQAIIIGSGRFGQLIIRLLRANGIASTVLDYDAEQIAVMQRFGLKTYFGDGTRSELLAAAGIERIPLLVVAIDDQESALAIVQMVRREYPRVQIFARAFDRVHAYKLLGEGAHSVMIETGGSAIDLGIEVLKALGFSAYRAHRQGGIFRRYNARSVQELAPIYLKADSKLFMREARQRLDLLDDLLRQEPFSADAEDSAFESAPR